ncbi:hypothetical protein HX082_12230 [Myroides odoratimimus]|uniref:hypothetical protein n=1 Tax=Myroides odoratimimus TaxID=76832 RepID=UPI00257494DE|nr:hypothetical protein [Myroides odoratimimus]MDM1510162.1 hypothetical protein [Myroides odoratimimus]
MSWIARYKNNEEVKVWNELRSLDCEQLNKFEKKDVEEVVKETISRISYNIKVIYNAFEIDYINNETPDDLLLELKNRISSYGMMSNFLETFYKSIDKVDFVKIREKYFPHENNLDPLYIESVKGMIELLSDGSWEEEMEDLIDEGEDPCIYISPDIYHKDNISGDVPYGIVIENRNTIDTLICNTMYGDIYFLDYLRLTFDNYGFTNLKKESIIPEKYRVMIKNRLVKF